MNRSCLLLLLPLASIMCMMPRTTMYRPISGIESLSFQKSDRNIYPNDVRINLNAIKEKMIAWPGIIKQGNFIYADSIIQINLIVQHHYYDWLEDCSTQKEKIFLSPRGEGIIVTRWALKNDFDSVAISRVIAPGNMVIIYGFPTEIVADSIIVIKSTYLRAIDKKWFRTDIMDYGREGEPVRLLR
jgi:hypothetical protein